MRISVGLPLYDGKVMHQQMGCLLTEVQIARALGHELIVRVLNSCTNLAMGRNQIVKDFLDTGDDRLVFLDSDVTFQPGDMVKLALYPEEFVGGIYPLKQDIEAYPVALLTEPKDDINPHGLIEVRSVPTGFLSLSKTVFDKFRGSYPDREYESRFSKSYCYFQIPYCDGALFTEDAYFCKEWREMGGTIFMDPEIQLSHWNGNIEFKGHIGKWFRKQQATSAKKQGEPYVSSRQTSP